jgi:hypothetical protein
MRAEVVGAAEAALKEKKPRPAPAVCRRADLRTWVLCGKSSEKAISFLYYIILRCNITAFLAVMSMSK